MYDRATMLWTLLWKIVKCHPRMKKLQVGGWEEEAPAESVGGPGGCVD